MKGMCKKCPEYSICTSICDKVKRILDKEDVTQKEFIPNKSIEDISNDSCWDSVNFENSNILKIIILKLYDDGMSRHEIAYHVPCSRSYIIYLINKYREGKDV